jgi:hypothetical protein
MIFCSQTELPNRLPIKAGRRNESSERGM